MKRLAHFIEYESISFQSNYVSCKCYALEQDLLNNQGAWYTAPKLTHHETGVSVEPKDAPFSDIFHWSRMYEYPYVFFRIVPFLKGQKILDAGGGRSIFQFFLSREAPDCQIYNVDNDADGHIYIHDAQRMKGFPNLNISLGDILDLSHTYGENYFDNSCCISVLEHMHDWSERKRAFQELIKVTKNKTLITMDIICKKIDGVFRPPQEMLSMLQELEIPVKEPEARVLTSYVPDQPENEDLRLMILFVGVEKRDV